MCLKTHWASSQLEGRLCDYVSNLQQVFTETRHEGEDLSYTQSCKYFVYTGPRKSKPLLDCNHLAHVKVLWKMYKFMCYCTVFLCIILNLRAILRVQAPRALYLVVRFIGGVFALRVWGAYIWRDLFSRFYGILIKRLEGFLSLRRVKMSLSDIT